MQSVAEDEEAWTTVTGKRANPPSQASPKLRRPPVANPPSKAKPTPTPTRGPSQAPLKRFNMLTKASAAAGAAASHQQTSLSAPASPPILIRAMKAPTVILPSLPTWLTRASPAAPGAAAPHQQWTRLPALRVNATYGFVAGDKPATGLGAKEPLLGQRSSIDVFKKSLWNKPQEASNLLLLETGDAGVQFYRETRSKSLWFCLSCQAVGCSKDLDKGLLSLSFQLQQCAHTLLCRIALVECRHMQHDTALTSFGLERLEQLYVLLLQRMCLDLYLNRE